MAFSKLISIPLRFFDPYDDTYGRIDIVVPRPTKSTDLPTIILSFRHLRAMKFFRASLADVRRHFRLTVDQRLALGDALAEARRIVVEIQEAERQELLGRTLPVLPDD